MTDTTLRVFILVLVALGVLGIAGPGTGDRQRVVFHNAQFHTLQPDMPTAQALLVVDGRIVALGDAASVALWRQRGTRYVDLQGATVVPGFIDAHSHFPAIGLRRIAVDLSAPPIGSIGSRAALIERIAIAVETHSGDGWLLGFNYDNTAFPDGLHPTRRDLDALSAEIPIFLRHSSGHMGVANSAALALLDIDESVQSSAGAFYGRDLADGRLSGLLQERAAPSLASLMRELPLVDVWRAFVDAREHYLSAGVTTVQNGHAGPLVSRLLDWAEWLGLLQQRVVVWPAHDAQSRLLMGHAPEPSRPGFVRGAVKLIVDGSPQGLTAHLSEPYWPASGVAPGYAGFSAFDPTDLADWVTRYHAAGYQLALHGNGDAAIDIIITAVREAQRLYPRDDARHVLVHAQVLRKDQIEPLRELGLTPSFFVAHTWYWGDWHRLRSLGPERAENISPTAWAQAAGLRFTLHADTPVTPMRPMQMIWSATRRETQSGHILGPAQRINRQQALRALTLDAAWQARLEDSRGSLQTGKLADFVVLSGDLMAVENVRDLRVDQTWIGGHLAWQRAP